MKNVTNYINPLPFRLRQPFFDTIARENHIRILGLNITILILHTLSIFGRKQPLPNDPVGMAMLLLLIPTAILALIFIYRKDMNKGHFFHIYTSIYCFLLLFAALRLSQIHLIHFGSMSLYNLILLSTSALFIRKPLVTFLTNWGLLFYFVANIAYITQTSNELYGFGGPRPGINDIIRFELYITDILIYTIFATILAGVFYRFRVKVFLDHKIIEEKNSTLMKLSMQDSMTGLLNHKSILSALKQEINRTQRYSLSLSILLIDIDHFKAVNDTYGHPAGDVVIKTIANILKNSCRETDFVGRYGGEEFLLVLTNTDYEQAMQFANRIRVIIENTTFDKPSSITISGGIKTYDNDSLKEFVQAADEALYRAKQLGRNRIESVSK